MSWTFVLPNLASFRSRGKLAERWALASELGCGVAELPADMIKNASEEARIGLRVGAIMPRASVEALYGPALPQGRFILHTDPGIPRRDRHGAMVVPSLRWGDREWSDPYAASVSWMAEAAGGKIEAVEVHPGRETGSTEDLVRGFEGFGRDLSTHLGRTVPILVENKHGHRMARIEDMVRMMDGLPAGPFGLVVDISNLWKTYRSRTAGAFDDLPWDRVKGIHLHLHHRAPQAGDPLDWDRLLRTMEEKGRDLLINPEVFHLGELKEALAFIRSWRDGT